MILGEARLLIQSLVKDEANKLDLVADLDRALKMALATYSKYSPRVLSQTLAVGTNGEILTSAITSFDEGFIEQMQIEYPILTGAGKQTWIDRSEWDLQQGTAGQVIRFYTIGQGQNVRVVHRVKHVLPASDTLALSVPESDTEAVCNLAAAEALQMLARLFTQTIDKYPQSDFVNFSNKGADYEARSKTHRRIFKDHIHRPYLV